MHARRLARWIEPEDAYRLLDREHPAVVWSDRSADTAEPVSFVGFATDERHLLVVEGAPDPSAVLPRLRAGLGGGSAPLGWWGWLGYECGETAMGLTPHSADSPGVAFLFAAQGLRFDHERHSVVAVSLDDDFRWTSVLDGSLPPAPPAASGRASWRHDRTGYLERIGASMEAIRRGDAYLLCLTNRLTVEPDGMIDPAAVYACLRSTAATRFGGVLRVGAWTLISGTPEQLLRVGAGGRATTSPIKGTRPRGRSPADDRELAEDLRSSVKERAENLMIVDLMRNDLSRVSDIGSVEVTRLFAVETYPTVHQLVSTIESDLAVDVLEALVALFPAGSMTGTPKRSAMALLHDLEGGPRGVYAGAWGNLAPDGTADLAVVIRSVLVGPGEVSVGTGGGITILSDPVAEWQELETKARSVLTALGVRIPR